MLHGNVIIFLCLWLDVCNWTSINFIIIQLLVILYWLVILILLSVCQFEITKKFSYIKAIVSRVCVRLNAFEWYLIWCIKHPPNVKQFLTGNIHQRKIKLWFKWYSNMKRSTVFEFQIIFHLWSHDCTFFPSFYLNIYRTEFMYWISTFSSQI